MKEVEYHELDMWGWECPECKEWNEEGENPASQETLMCQGCGEQFEPTPG